METWEGRFPVEAEMKFEKMSQILTRKAILGTVKGMSGTPGSQRSGHVCGVASRGFDCRIGYVNGNMRKNGRLRHEMSG